MPFGTYYYRGFYTYFILSYVEEFRLDQDPEISGHHLTFKWNLEKDCLQIRDEKSFNGTALNLKIIKPGVFYDVRDNSVLNVGKSRFTISVKEKLDETTEKVSTESTSSKESLHNIYFVITRLLLPWMF